MSWFRNHNKDENHTSDQDRKDKPNQEQQQNEDAQSRSSDRESRSGDENSRSSVPDSSSSGQAADEAANQEGNRAEQDSAEGESEAEQNPAEEQQPDEQGSSEEEGEDQNSSGEENKAGDKGGNKSANEGGNQADNDASNDTGNDASNGASGDDSKGAGNEDSNDDSNDTAQVPAGGQSEGGASSRDKSRTAKNSSGGLSALFGGAVGNQGDENQTSEDKGKSGSSGKRKKGASSGSASKSGQNNEEEKEDKLDSDLKTNISRLKETFKNCSDIIYRPFTLKVSGKEGMLIYLDGMCDSQQVEDTVLRPLMEGPSSGEAEDKKTAKLEEQLVSALHTTRENKVKTVIQNILKGQTAVLADGDSDALLVDLVKMEQRSIGEPTSEKVVRGPRDGFTEALRTNTSLIRRRISSSRLKAEALTIGTFTRTNIALMYIDGIAKDTLVDEVRGRIQDIDVDGLLYSQDIEEYIEDKVYSPFPQVQNTERPDVASSSLLEGKVVIVVDNSPIVLIAPMTYWSGLQAADDYTERTMYATLVRWVRYIFVHISLLLPSLYVALTTFHPEVIPTPLLISIASAREGVPFPAVIEALLMELIFEGLREAGIRLPQQVGPAVSIAGALVIGQAVVEAGIVSSTMVIIVSLTGIASFAFPMYNIGTSFRMLRFPLLLISGFIGFYGVMLFLILMTVHLVSLKPFGVPYMAPATPLEVSNLKDILIRAPKWKMNKRMGILSGRNKDRSPVK